MRFGKSVKPNPIITYKAIKVSSTVRSGQSRPKDILGTSKRTTSSDDSITDPLKRSIKNSWCTY